MKRGFLQAKGKVAPAQAEAKPLKPVLIPISPQAPPGTQIVNIDSLTLLNLNVVSMPQLNIPTSFLLYTGTKEAILKELGHMKVEPPPLALPFTIEEVPGQVKELEVEPPPLALPFTIEEVPGQGHGTFAKNAFNTGDLIWDEHPLLVFPQVFNPYSVYTRERCVELAIERLVPALRDMFYMLHNCKSNDPKDVDGICATNAIDIGRFPGPHEYGHAAVFLLISRFNHRSFLFSLSDEF
ncbi:hypothetical protein C0992_001347 [Termitomyces sp. T32_za158]|nr:hypothetical protein C0992_001347 [Termitomyces sp. T32_za158]